jgi:hypothetical protein
MEEQTMTFAKTLAVGTFLATTLIAGSAFAKAHDQGSGGKNGNAGFTDVGQTVAAAQSLGGAKGNRPADKGPMNGAADNAGGPADRE